MNSKGITRGNPGTARSRAYNAEACRLLLLAAIERAFRDSIEGDESAEAWIESDCFEHWCSYLSIEVDWARRQLRRRIRDERRAPSTQVRVPWTRKQVVMPLLAQRRKEPLFGGREKVERDGGSDETDH